MTKIHHFDQIAWHTPPTDPADLDLTVEAPAGEPGREGSCTFNGEPMARFDLTVVEANEPYGFVAGDDGVQFLVVRQDIARFLTE